MTDAGGDRAPNNTFEGTLVPRTPQCDRSTILILMNSKMAVQITNIGKVVIDIKQACDWYTDWYFVSESVYPP